MADTLYDKIWNQHLVKTIPEGPGVLYIDQHFIHEVSSPQAFRSLEERGQRVRRPDRTLAVADHNVPTWNQHLPIKEEMSRKQVALLEENCKKHGVMLYGLGHPLQGIVHVVGPETGITQPGMTIVCGDSHTSTHGAFGTIAFGIGTSEVEMVLASQCMMQYKPKQMRIRLDGKLPKGCTSKDVILFLLAKLTASGGTGHFIEYAGEAIQNMSMEERMTICNMSIELGARGGLIAPDETTFAYMKGRQFAPKGLAWDEKLRGWQTLFSDAEAQFDLEYQFDISNLSPRITFGTNPGQGIAIDQPIPKADQLNNETDAEQHQQALDYMDLRAGMSLSDFPLDEIFIGSCTNARIEDLRQVAQIWKGRKVDPNLRINLVPGSSQVAAQAEEEGLAAIFSAAGVQMRQAGCSACLGMNEDKVRKGAYCLSTSNRNFEGRQGPGARTFLASPMTAAASAITGKITDPRDWVRD
ncbi:MAG: 3-isopropylmalate dehydratase large subunit [Cyclobacteriaceae bacterium]|nr:3-isopropylmalate dehydratase large subunit [Cyclobacteriaceae bacterium]MCH8516272.1 3-isopropylmalate dehydratase large subunit [Cyclobacteriaceae bacterium]